VVFFVLVVASFFTPDTPDADDPTSEIAVGARDQHRDAPRGRGWR
jgi:hypothetical protein